MTVPPPAAGASAAWPVSGTLLRALTAWTLLALAGVIIVFGALSWIVPPAPTGLMSRFAPDRFTQIVVLVAPLLAVLVAARLGPPLRLARLIGSIALIEYAAALLLGTLGFLITLASRFDGLGRGVYALGGLVQILGGILSSLLLLALLGLAGLWTARLYSSLGGRLPWLQVR